MRLWQASIVVLIAAVLAMYPILSNEFVHWDDQDTIFENGMFNPPQWASVKYYLTNPEGGLYVPATYAFWTALALVAHTDSAGIYGEHLNPLIFHAASLALHLTAAILVLTILRKLRFTPLACLLGALIFAVHPLQVETVAWASAAKDLLYANFSLLCVWQYLLFASREKHRAIHYAIAFLALVIAMFCKPTALVVPVILAVLDRLFVKRSWRAIFIAVLPMVAILSPLMVVARRVQDCSAVPPVAMMDRILIAGDALSFYLGKLFFPYHLCMDYGRSPPVEMRMLWIRFAWLIPTAIAVGLWAFRRRIPKVIIGSLLFLAPLLPVLGFTPFMFQAHSSVADHYLYLPMLGVAIILAAVMDRWRRGWSIALTAVVILMVCANLQARTWADSFSLFSQAVKVNPNNSAEQGNLGNALAMRSDFTDAIPHLRRAIEIDPKNRLPHLILAQVALSQGRYEEAITEAHIAISVARPGESLSKEHLIAGQAMIKLNRPDDAAREFRLRFQSK